MYMWIECFCCFLHTHHQGNHTLDLLSVSYHVPAVYKEESIHYNHSTALLDGSVQNFARTKFRVTSKSSLFILYKL